MDYKRTRRVPIEYFENEKRKLRKGSLKARYESAMTDMMSAEELGTSLTYDELNAWAHAIAEYVNALEVVQPEF